MNDYIEIYRTVAFGDVLMHHINGGAMFEYNGKELWVTDNKLYNDKGTLGTYILDGNSTQVFLNGKCEYIYNDAEYAELVRKLLTEC